MLLMSMRIESLAQRRRVSYWPNVSRAVPGRRWNRKAHPELPSEIVAASLSHPATRNPLAPRGILEFGTLGSGNHFAELQADGDNGAVGSAARFNGSGEFSCAGSGLP